MASGALRSTELETKTYSVSKLIESIRAGRVRIPRFQRGFRWNDEDRRLLFDSLQKGFPVGTLLLASGHAPADKVALGGYVIDVSEEGDALWVVDGQQRLSTLAMALLEDHTAAYRPLYFDLEREEFVLGSRRRAAKPSWVPTHVLLTSATANRWLRENGIPDDLSDRADEIARRIREYQLPAYLVPYDGSDDSVLKQIFARVNRRGRALETHEVFEALHGSMRGDAGPIDRARHDLAKLGFGTVDAKLIERAALAVAGADPGRPLDEQIGGRVGEVFDRVVAGMARTIEFLAGDVGVPHVELLPYASPMAVLTRFFALHPDPHPRTRDLLSRWFWRGTLSAAHRTDYSADRRNWGALDGHEHESVKRLLDLLQPALSSRDLPNNLEPFRRGNARADVEVLAQLALEPKVLAGDDMGRDVSVATLLDGDGRRFPHQLVEPASGGRKTLACFILHPPLTVEELRAAAPSSELLATHAMDPTDYLALVEGRSDEFLARREDRMLRHLRTFLTDRIALGSPDRDRLAIDAYLHDESA